MSAQITADTSISVATFTTFLTFPAATYGNVKHYLEIAIPNLRSSIVTGAVYMILVEGGTQVGNIVQFDMSPTPSNGANVFARVRFTPTAASHTYALQWQCTSGSTATIHCSSPLVPAEFRIVQA